MAFDRCSIKDYLLYLLTYVLKSLLAQYLTMQWREFNQTLVDDVVEAKYTY